MVVKRVRRSLALTHPEIAAEAYGWDPSLETYGSNKELAWKCSKEHIFVTSPNSRTRRGKVTKCPECSNQLLNPGVNDLATTHPEVAAEAEGWDPTQVTAGMGEKRSWICKLGHSYETKISHRAAGSNCPYCTNRRVLKGFNDLATTHPRLAEQAYGWDPSEVSYGSGKLLKWKCSQGHVFITTPNRRTNRGQDSLCPIKYKGREHQ